MLLPIIPNRELVMNKKTILLPIIGMLLSGCAGGTAKDNYEVTWLSPTGAPTLAFYDQGDNDNWLSTSTPADIIPGAFASQSYDAIVFDGVSGLTMVKAKQREYKLAKWINEGSFYVVSTKHTADEKVVEGSLPTVDAFVSTGNASKAFRDLAKNTWKWGEYPVETEASKITYEKGVADIKTHLLGTDADAYDYYVVAEPVLTAVRGKYVEQGKTLNIIYNLQEEFASAHEGAKIPAAGIFVSNKSYSEHKSVIDTWLEETQERIENVKSGADVAFSGIRQYELSGKSSDERFGINSNMFRTQQVVGHNKLQYLSKDDVTDLAKIANDFNSALGEALTFDSSCFLS